MIVWHDDYQRDLSLADALERDARNLSSSIWTRWQAWLARMEATRLRRAYEPRGVLVAIAAAPECNPDGTDANGRIVNHTKHMAFYARKGRKRGAMV